LSVTENSVSPVSIDLELERKTYIPSGSLSGETEKPKIELDDALVHRVAARIVSVSGMSDHVSFAISFARRWIGLGATEETIISAIQKHQATIRNNGEEPRRLKVFEDEVLRGIEAQQVMDAMPIIPPAEAYKTEDMYQFEDTWSRATQVWQKAFADCRDFGAVTRHWPDLAQDHGLPPLPYDRKTYQHFFHDCGSSMSLGQLIRNLKLCAALAQKQNRQSEAELEAYPLRRRLQSSEVLYALCRTDTIIDAHVAEHWARNYETSILGAKASTSSGCQGRLICCRSNWLRLVR
jgi:hypothetical protein